MKRKIISALAIMTIATSIFTGCGAKEDAVAKTEDTAKNDTSSTNETSGEKNFKMLTIWSEDEVYGKLLTGLMEGYKTDMNENFNYEYELVSSDSLKQKVATLVASNDLPDMFAYESGRPIVDLIEADKLVNMSTELNDLGVYGNLEDGATSLLKTLSGTEDLYDLPLGLNIEGFWYNKELFETAGVEVPTTWEEFEAVCEELNSLGIQPLTAGGADRWPLTRLVNAYAYRSMGVDAMEKASTGEASYTDEGYVASAKAIQDLANKGYFGQGVVTVDMGTAGDMVMSGTAAMLYNGSWFAGDLNEDTNPAGMDGVGFFNVPVVDDSISSQNEYSMNCGNILVMDKSKYDDVSKEFLKYFVDNVGNTGMEDYGTILGYKYTVEPNLSPYTQIVADELAKVEKSTTWFEASMNSETATIAQEQIQTLINGEITPEDYMEQIQNAYNMSN
ncbi:MAG: ABC transporter substrate-binding protein [Lachnospirales bacterium]